MYEQSKRALRKVFGEQVMSHESTMREDVNAVEEAHYTSYRGKLHSSRGRYRGRGGRGCSNNVANGGRGFLGIATNAPNV